MILSIPILEFVQDATDLKLLRELLERITGAKATVVIKAEATRISIDDDLICKNEFVKPFLLLSIDYEHKQK